MWVWAKKLNGHHSQLSLVEVVHVMEGGRKRGGFSLYSFVMKISTMPHHLMSPSVNDYSSLLCHSSLSILMTSLILLWGSLVSVIGLLAKVNVSKTDCYSTLIFFFLRRTYWMRKSPKEDYGKYYFAPYCQLEVTEKQVVSWFPVHTRRLFEAA